MDSNPTPDDQTEPIIDGLLGREGGSKYTNRAADKGGPTRWGITQVTLSKWRGRSVSPQEVAELAEGEAREIYRELYILGPQFQRIDDDLLRNSVIDSGVNHGVGWAARRLQEVAGVEADGILGPITLRAVNGAEPNDLHLKFCARRNRKYADIVIADLKKRGMFEGQVENLRGWINRSNEMMLQEVDR